MVILDRIDAVVCRAARRLATLLWLLVHPTSLDRWTTLAYLDDLRQHQRVAHPHVEVVTHHVLPVVADLPVVPAITTPPLAVDPALPPALTDLPVNRVECVLVGTDGTLHSVMSMYASARGATIIKAHGKDLAAHYHVRERHGTRWIYELQESAR